MSGEGIGALRHRLVIEAVQTTPDGGGGFSESWVEIATVWASIAAKSGGEALQADRVTGTLRHDISIRYRDDVQPAMRFRKGQRVFHILGCENVGERQVMLKCLCEERDL